jgi:serine/threonine protein kinase
MCTEGQYAVSGYWYFNCHLLSTVDKRFPNIIEYLAQGNLLDLIHAEFPFKEETVLFMAMDIAAGMYHIHVSSIILLKQFCCRSNCFVAKQYITL